MSSKIDIEQYIKDNPPKTMEQLTILAKLVSAELKHINALFNVGMSQCEIDKLVKEYKDVTGT